MKKIISTMLVIIMTLSLIPSSIYANEDDFEFIILNNKAVITGYKGLGGDVTIPADLGGYPVESIDNYAFEECQDIIQIELPVNLKKIGRYAFEDCKNLININIPGSLIDFAYDAFWGCNSLVSIDVDESNSILSSVNGVLFNKAGTKLIQYPASNTTKKYIVPDSTLEISERAFYNSAFLEELEMSDKITKIGPEAFSESKKLTSIKLSDELKLIEYGLFSNCKSLKSIILAKGIREICYDAFSGCEQLNTIQIPTNILKIGQNVFEGCKNLISVKIANTKTALDTNIFQDCIRLKSVILPSEIKKIPYGTFFNCRLLEKVIIPKNVTKIEGAAFFMCKSLALIILPKGLKRIGMGAFESCAKLASITIPRNVNFIEDNPFEGCSSLVNINVSKYNVTYSSIKGVLYNKKKTNIRICPGGKKGTITIPSTVWSIADSAFSSCSKLTSMTIPKNIKYIGMNAFRECKKLARISLSDGIQKIYDSFVDCSSLQSINIPSTVKDIYNTAFQGCNSLKKINVNSGNKYYSSVDGVLLNKSRTILKTFPPGKSGKYIVPKTIVRIQYYSFQSCKKITEVILPEGLRIIEDLAFAYCTGLKSIKFPKTLTLIDEAAFVDCSHLKTVIFMGNAPTLVESNEPFDETGGVFSGCNTNYKIYYIYGNKGFSKRWYSYEAIPMIPAPAVKLSKLNTTSIKISWSKFKYASGYKVYRANSKTGKYKVITSIFWNNTSFTDKNLIEGKNYYYKVRVFKRLTSGKYLFSNYSNAKRINMTTVIYGK